MKRVTRNRARVCYYEPDEPSFDEYIFCTSCGDYVYEYCSIHGPLLVIPDTEVATPAGCPSLVPRAALTIPTIFLHLAPSTIPGAGIGVFSTLTLPSGVRFGPYRGVKTDEANSTYCWQILDAVRRPTTVVDASDARSSNWMRYVNCSRHSREQNLVAFQYQGQMYYRTIKTVPRFTELLVFYGSEFACRLGVDLRRYNTPVYTEILVKSDDGNEKQKNESNDKIQEVDKENSSVDVKEDFTENSETHEDTESNCETVFPSMNKQYTHTDINVKDLEKNDGNKEEENVQSAKYVCDICAKIFNEKAAIIDHLATHNSINITKYRDLKFSCPYCDSQFSTKSDLFNHDIEIHDSKKHYKACNICDYKSIKFYDLKQHMERHSGIRKYKCDICEYAGITKKCLSKHKNTHLKDRPCHQHVCPNCGKIFTRKSGCNRHLRICDGHSAYSCQICDSKFNQKSEFRIHTMLHKVVNPPTCTICGKKFVWNYSLQRHTKIHSQEKDFKCGQCDKSFSERYKLTRHEKIHLSAPFHPPQSAIVDNGSRALDATAQ